MCFPCVLKAVTEFIGQLAGVAVGAILGGAALFVAIKLLYTLGLLTTAMRHRKKPERRPVSKPGVVDWSKAPMMQTKHVNLFQSKDPRVAELREWVQNGAHMQPETINQDKE